MRKVLAYLVGTWKVKVIAVTSDASGESRKARTLLVKEMLQLVAPDCYAHQVSSRLPCFADWNDQLNLQINLIVGDFLKAQDPSFGAFQEMAADLITWLRSKTYLLAKLRECQIGLGMAALAIIRAVITWWTAHYLAYSQLHEVRPALQALISRDEARDPRTSPESDIITGDARAKAKAQKMVEIIKNGDFWATLER